MKVCLTEWPDRTYIGHRADYYSQQEPSAGAPNDSAGSGTRESEPNAAIESLRFVGLHEIVSFLREYKRSFRALLGLRSLASGRVYSAHRFDNEQVIQHVAGQILCGNLVVWKEILLRPVLSPVVAVRPPPAARSEPSPSPPPKSPRPAEQPRPEVRRPTTPAVEAAPVDDVNYEAQATTLKLAAKDGTPFCEECEKMRRARAA
jgi:hypothetical protein